MAQQTRCYRYDFRGHLAFPLTASGVGTPWVTAITSSGSTPTVLGLAGGGVRLLMTSDSEIQNVCLYMGDLLAFDIDQILRVWFIAKTVAELDSTTQLAFGAIGNRNDAIDSIAQAAIFRCVGDNNVVVESDDGTNNNDDVAAGLTLGTDWKRFEINLADRTTTLEPPSASTGGKSNVGFHMGNSLGSLRRVAEGTRFDMSNYSGSLQLFAQIQKTADNNVDNLDILECGVEVKLPNYS